MASFLSIKILSRNRLRYFPAVCFNFFIHKCVHSKHTFTYGADPILSLRLCYSYRQQKPPVTRKNSQHDGQIPRVRSATRKYHRYVTLPAMPAILPSRVYSCTRSLACIAGRSTFRVLSSCSYMGVRSLVLIYILRSIYKYITHSICSSYLYLISALILFI